MGIADTVKSLGEGVAELAGKVADGAISGLEAAGAIVEDVTPDDVSPLEDAGDAVPDDAPGALLDVAPDAVGVFVDVLAGGVA